MIIAGALWRIVFGGLAFFGCTATSDWIWRRGVLLQQRGAAGAKKIAREEQQDQAGP